MSQDELAIGGHKGPVGKNDETRENSSSAWMPKNKMPERVTHGRSR
jgi:hypothetical protein